jgi:catechol 2,3-dioxygenase-like lactoylglutathione lyase family enzyme
MDRVGLETSGIAAAITANDLQRSLHFYVDGLGFSVLEKGEVDGQLRFVMLKAGNGELGLGRDDFAKGKDRVKGVGMRLWITTAQDLHPLAEQAKRAGIALDSEVAPSPWGPLAFSVTDPDGFKLTILNPR